MPNYQLLTQDEVDHLDDGTPVTITWSGGNGPHEYVVAVRPDRVEPGDRYAAPADDPHGKMRYYPGVISFVGNAKFHTKVIVGHNLPDEARQLLGGVYVSGSWRRSDA